MGKVIAIFSTTGGVGVSTVAAYLAYILAGENETAVVDMVPDFGCVGDYFGFHPKPSSGKFPVLFGKDSTNLLQELSVPRRPRLKIFSMPPSVVSPQQIDWKAFFNSARKTFAYTVLDLPHTFLAPELRIGIDQADEIIEIGEYHWATITQIKNFFESCDDAVKDKCKMVMNRSEWLPEDVLAECRANLNQKIVAELPFDPHMECVRKLKEGSILGKGIKSLVKKLVGEAKN